MSRLARVLGTSSWSGLARSSVPHRAWLDGRVKPGQDAKGAVRREMSARFPRSLPPWLVSWLQVSPLALVLVTLFVLPTALFLVVSFFDYDRVGIYPAFIFDNYHDLLTTPATLRVYISSLKFAFIALA